MMNKEVLSPTLMILGVDGMDPRLSKKYMDEGKMPNLKKIVERGAAREDLVLLGAQPTVTPSQWTTLGTGAYPSTHGITQFNRCVPGRIEQMAYNFDSRNCKAEPAWNCLAEAGRKTLVFHWPGSAWPPTSDSENLYVIDGAAPGSIGSSTMQVDSEIVVIGSPAIEEPTYKLDGSQDATAPCVVKRGTAEVGGAGASLGEKMRARNSMGVEKVQEMADNGVETNNVLLTDSDGMGTRAGNSMTPTTVSLTPIKDAKGWVNAPADAREFTILLCEGKVRRVGLLLKN